MYKGMYVAVSGALAAERQLNTLTNNLANINTPGFKGDQLTFESYLSKSERKNAVQGDGNNLAGSSEYVLATGQYTNFEQGALRATGSPLDVALNGDGFFAVMTYEGERYTRAGHFQVGSDGALVNAQGHPVLDETDRLIYVYENFLTIDKDGTVWVTDSDEPSALPRDIGKMKIVEFTDPANLIKEGNGLFKSNEPNAAMPSPNSEVVQGSLENSNVNIIRQMTGIIRNERVAEAFKKVIQENDQMTTQLIIQIGRP